MSDSITPERLSQIATMWTLLAQRDVTMLDESRAKAAAFVERYQRAVYGYLLSCVRDPDRAMELFQEFALRFLRGDFRRADPECGRFRDYLRSALINLVRRSHRPGGAPAVQALDAIQFADDEQSIESPEDEAFLAQWREAILAMVWQSLEADQTAGGPPYHAALQARSNRAEESSAQLAQDLTARLNPGEAFTDAGVRKLLQRGREVFSDRIVAEVAQSIPTQDPERVAQELIDLGFHSFCTKALERWRSNQ